MHLFDDLGSIQTIWIFVLINFIGCTFLFDEIINDFKSFVLRKESTHAFPDIGDVHMSCIALGNEGNQTGANGSGVGVSVGLGYVVVHSESPKNKYS